MIVILQESSLSLQISVKILHPSPRRVVDFALFFLLNNIIFSYYDWISHFIGTFVFLSFKQKCWYLEAWESKVMSNFLPGYHLLFFLSSSNRPLQPGKRHNQSCQTLVHIGLDGMCLHFSLNAKLELCRDRKQSFKISKRDSWMFSTIQQVHMSC